MDRPTAHRIFLLSLVTFALILAPNCAFAQHAGGGHAGGGGGGHVAAPSGGGGFHAGGSVAAPVYRNPGAGSFSRPVAPVYGFRGVTRAPGGYRPYPGYSSAGGGTRATGQYRALGSAPTETRPYGQWRPFSSTPGAGTANPGGNGAQGHSFVNGGPAGRPNDNSTVRSFAGQGNELFETTARNAAAASVASRARVLANVKSVPAGSLPLGGSRNTAVVAPALGASLTASRLGSGLLHANLPVVPARNVLTPGASTLVGSGLVGSGRVAAARVSFGSQNFAIGLRGNGFGRGFGLRGRGRGWGRFGGFGIRRPWFGFGFFGPIYVPVENSCVWGPNWNGVGFGYDPFDYGFTPCYGPFGVGLNSPSYYNPYPDAGTYVYGSDPYDPSIDGQPPDVDTAPNAFLNAPTDQGAAGDAGDAPDLPDNGGSNGSASGAIRQNVQIFLKNGGIFNVILYWVDRGQLNFVTDNGSAIAMSMDQIDLQRTISENAKQGKLFNLPGQADGGSESAPGNTLTPDTGPKNI